jgi:pimeloyl-ACP methyl ester carboxylesterase
MLVHEKAPARVAAAIINDVGPDLAPEGIARIAGYVGKTTEPATTLEDAAMQIRAINEIAFPDAPDDQWIAFATRTFRKTDAGYVLDYDPRIAEALVANGPAPDLWPAWSGMIDTPTLLVHGELSDLLTMAIVEKMRDAHPTFEYVRVPRIGHAPMMTEPAAWEGIEAFFSRLDC